MEERIAFERFLYGDGMEICINDTDFCLDRIIMLPQLRPHQLDKAVMLSAGYCQNSDFKGKLLEKSNECHVLIYRLYKIGVFEFEEIEPFLRSRNTLIFCYYFRKEIKDFESFISKKAKLYGFDESFLANEEYFDELIEYGFLPSSIEYSLKYDDVICLRDMSIVSTKECKWSPFEWSSRPKYLDLLSFSGFFGSIQCFKHLLMNGFVISDKVFSMVVCSGCLDLFHFCQGQRILSTECVCNACEFLHFPLLVFMIENGCDINIKNIYQETPLHCSARNGHLSIVEYLINHGVDINAQKKLQHRNNAVQRPNNIIIKSFQNTGYGFNRNNNNTPLHYSAEKGHFRIVECLVSHGADVNPINDDLFTPLHFSAEKGYIDIVKYLTNHGVDTNSTNTHHWTPLHFSSKNGHFKVVECLLKKGADANSKNSYSWTPLHFSAQNGHLNIVECLIKHGAEVNARTESISLLGIYGPLFICLPKKAILVLLNALLIMERILMKKQRVLLSVCSMDPTTFSNLS